MNKSIIGNYLIAISSGFILGFFVSQYSQNKKNGERPLQELHQSTKKEEAKIDSLNLDIVKIDSRIKKHKQKKLKNYEEYKKDTIAINSMEFDSLTILFLKYYPR